MKRNEEIGITVVMPAYNAEKTIGHAIDSVLRQTHTKFELIVVDDCSGDQTASIVLKYAAMDSRVRLVRNDCNSGVAVSRNHGVKEAQFEWIALLDSDDSWAQNKLQLQLDAMLACPESAICFTGTAYVKEDGLRCSYVLHAPERVTRDEILKQNVISCSSVLAKRDALLKFPMPDARNIHEDLATWVSILSTTPYAVGVDLPLLIYRVSSSGKSGNKVEAAKMQWRTYRVCRVPLYKSVFYFGIYAWRNVRKYRSLRHGSFESGEMIQ